MKLLFVLILTLIAYLVALIEKPVEHLSKPPQITANLYTPTQSVSEPTHTSFESACTPNDGSGCQWGCAAAQSYWDVYGNHAFSFSCTGCNSCRPQGETCPDHCSNSDCGSWCVLINEPCPIAYRNEASNSQTWRNWFWAKDRVAAGLDPYGGSC